jgi:hypothetical protein
MVPSGQCGGFLRPYSRFLDRSRYFFFKVAPQLYSRGCVDPFKDPLLLRKSSNAGYRTRTSESVAKNSDYYTNSLITPSRFVTNEQVSYRAYLIETHFPRVGLVSDGNTRDEFIAPEIQ